ncbi:alpha-glucosidase [Granulicella pectinivorans]|uniref:Alpha-glucosidase n=1 Tax=Granulicella pectinivorans TaxID=474950 RepID=A0A1I6MPP4_9BACT|nr:alpha-glucosidase [Granulicella pectinivorans]SFS17581.1 alpha-glucosidase [Granulicella pectinivorans]
MRRLLSALLALSLLPSVLTAQTAVQLKSAATPSTDSTWWKHAVIYEIYPRSFQDTNGDGVGDLNGITQRLGYLEGLGVDAIWISPMYPSPQVDFGYDISDYENIDPQYGTLADFDHLLADAEKHHIKIILDMVLNHTSDHHKWFEEAASSRTNPKHDWYVWSDGKPGTGPLAHEGRVPPNNWVALFGGSAWEWSPKVHQFYYHKFYKQQPDLNWRNPAVEKAMFGTMRFWLDRGVAGFRLDAVPTLFEDAQLRDEPIAAPGTNAQGDPNLNDVYTNMLPEVHGVLRRMRVMADKYPGHRVLIGETYLPNTAELLKWYGGPARNELHLPMDMLVGFHSEGGGPNSENVSLDLPHIRQTLNEMETTLGPSQPLLVFDNHDNPRSWDRFGDGVHNAQIARIIATILFTSRATAMMYYGEEIGMVTATPTRVEDVKDPIGITGWPREKGRDGERTPMQWSNADPEADFSTDPKTWLPVTPNYITVNVKTEAADADSLLNWHTRLIHLRRDLPALHDGGFVLLNPANPNVLSYGRTAPSGAPSAVVALNFSAQPQTITLDLAAAKIKASAVETILTSAPSLAGNTSLTITLPPFASWIGSVR